MPQFSNSHPTKQKEKEKEKENMTLGICLLFRQDASYHTKSQKAIKPIGASVATRQKIGREFTNLSDMTFANRHYDQSIRIIL